MGDQHDIAAAAAAADDDGGESTATVTCARDMMHPPKCVASPRLGSGSGAAGRTREDGPSALQQEPPVNQSDLYNALLPDPVLDLDLDLDRDCNGGSDVDYAAEYGRLAVCDSPLLDRPPAGWSSNPFNTGSAGSVTSPAASEAQYPITADGARAFAVTSRVDASQFVLATGHEAPTAACAASSFETASSPDIAMHSSPSYYFAASSASAASSAKSTVSASDQAAGTASTKSHASIVGDPRATVNGPTADTEKRSTNLVTHTQESQQQGHLTGRGPSHRSLSVAAAAAPSLLPHLVASNPPKTGRSLLGAMSNGGTDSSRRRHPHRAPAVQIADDNTGGDDNGNVTRTISDAPTASEAVIPAAAVRRSPAHPSIPASPRKINALTPTKTSLKSDSVNVMSSPSILVDAAGPTPRRPQSPATMAPKAGVLLLPAINPTGVAPTIQEIARWTGGGSFFSSGVLTRSTSLVRGQSLNKSRNAPQRSANTNVIEHIVIFSSCSAHERTMYIFWVLDMLYCDEVSRGSKGNVSRY